MPRQHNEGDWVRLIEPVRGATLEGVAWDLQSGMEGQVIIGSEAHPGVQIVEFPVDVLDAAGRPGDIPLFVEAELLDRQVEAVRRP